MLLRSKLLHRRKRPVAVAAISVATGTLFVSAFAAGYNHGVGGPSPLLCALHAADCSTAFATWVLCIVTIGTIVTGFALFGLETQNQLTTFSCEHEGGTTSARAARMPQKVKIPATEDASAATAADTRVRKRHLYVVRRYERIQREGRAVYEEPSVPQVRLTATFKTKYDEYFVDVENLGRSALIDLAVELAFDRRLGNRRTKVAIQLPLGGLGDKKELHVVIHIEASLNAKNVLLTGRAFNDGVPFSFRPIHQPEPRFVEVF